MSHYPGSTWRPVSYRGLHARQPRKAACLHTNGGGAQLFGWWSQIAAQGKHIGAQYQVFNDGSSECYTDPSLVLYHAYSASEWSIGIETEDDGNNSRPWTAAQIHTIAAICHFHEVPPQMLTGSGAGDGVGFHQQQPSWNQTGHDCPGAVRVRQIPLVLHALAALYKPTPTEVDVTPEQDVRLKNIEQLLIGLVAPRRSDHADTDTAHVSLGDVLTDVENQK